MKRINWKIVKRDLCTIYWIVARMEHMGLVTASLRGEMVMDLVACHLNGCPLDLGALLRADDFDFIHDVGGIRRHMDRKTGQLGGCFLPRCALEEVAA